MHTVVHCRVDKVAVVVVNREPVTILIQTVLQRCVDIFGAVTTAV